MTLLFLAAVACIALAAFLVGETVTVPSRERWSSLRRAARYGRASQIASGDVRTSGSFRERALVPLRARLAELALRLTPQSSVESTGRKLLVAGLGRQVTATGFLAAKAAAALGGLLLGALLAGVGGRGLSGVLFAALALAAAGLFAPDALVTMLIRSRREQIRAELPDALDLLAVSVEAGLGFDAAIVKLTEHMDGPLSEEFALTLSEVRIGESRQSALRKLSDRTEVSELSSFTLAIIQADQLGISLGRILRSQATDSRLRRQAAAEERAMKAPIKMLFPTVLFIFPAMFLVILGPAFLNLSRLF